MDDKNKDLIDRIEFVGSLMKDTLGNFNLYLSMDIETEEFIFMDRDTMKYGRIAFKDINAKYDK